MMVSSWARQGERRHGGIRRLAGVTFVAHVRRFVLIGLAVMIGVVAPLSNASASTSWTSVSTPLATLHDPSVATGQKFGDSVALSSDGTTAVVGDPSQGSSGTDVAHVFHVSSEGSWQSAYPVASLEVVGGAADNFGSSVSISSDGSTVLIGSPGASSGTGAAYLFHVSSENDWTTQSEPTATLTTAGGLSGDEFGTSVTLSSDGTTALIGAIDVNTLAGAAYVFHVSNEGSWADSASPTATLTDAGEATDGELGKSTAFSSDGTTALVGGQNAAYVFHAAAEGSWASSSSPLAELTAVPGSFNFGASVAMSSDGATALIGSNSETPAGAAYVFHVSNEDTWATTSNPTAVLTAASASGEIFATTVSISANGTTALIGSEGATTTGSAYVFSATNAASWSSSADPAARLTNASGTGDGSEFGSAVALSADATTALIGDDASNPQTGGAYIYNSSQKPPPPPPPPAPPQPPAPTPQHGYWLVGSDGGIFDFGSAGFYGSTGSLSLNRPVVGISPTAAKNGYWLVASDGGIFAFDAPYVGSIPGLGIAPYGSGQPQSLAAPIVGMVPADGGQGYFLVGSDGGVFAFNSHFAGSCPGIGGCSGRAVAVVPDATGNGYWVVTSTGSVYGFGDASYFGAPGPQSSPITSAVATPDGRGYWILDAAGQVFGYGDASYSGALPVGAAGGVNPAAAIFAGGDDGSYWVSTAAGKVYPFGGVSNFGDMSSTKLNGSIIAASGF